jgi:hypothetical protein
MGDETNHEELSMEIIDQYPKDVWNRERLTLMPYQGRTPTLDETIPLCTFAAKLSYTPRQRYSLGSTPAELIIIVNFYHFGAMFATLNSGTNEAPADSLTQRIEGNHLKVRVLNGTGTGFKPSITGRWETRLACVTTCPYDSYYTLAIVVSPQSLIRRYTQSFLVIAKRKCMLFWTTHIANREARKVAEESVTFQPSLDGYGGDVPVFTVEELYGGRKQWRKMRNNDRH